MTKQVGLWIDRRKAVIVTLSDAGEEVKTISSETEKNGRFTSDASEDGSSEDVRDRQYLNHLNAYYDTVVTAIRDANAIQIFGPGEAKLELEKRCEHHGLKSGVVTVETADKMTDRQIAAKARERFKS